MKIGFAFCGSFCNHPGLLKIYEDIAREHEIVPILSENAAKYSTRFGTAEDFVTRVEAVAGRRAVRNIVEAEPLGPQGAMEALVIAPCTGNTLAKLAHGITDGPVTMATEKTTILPPSGRIMLRKSPHRSLQTSVRSCRRSRRRWRGDSFSRSCCEAQKGRNFLPFCDVTLNLRALFPNAR